MSADEYLTSILQKYAVNAAGAEAAGQSIYPVIEKWAGSSLLNAEFSGSLAKGTAVSIGTDADIFISLSSSTTDTLSHIYSSLYNAVTNAGYTARKQNVSIGLKSNGYSIDLVPGRRQSQYGNEHSLYLNKTNTWTKSDVKSHIAYVKSSGRTDEIKILKIWRQLHGLDFPSFFLEMTAINALAYARVGNLASNVLTCLDFFRDNIKTVRYIDPANTNNIISDVCTIAEKNIIANQAANSRAQQNWESIVW
jgi:hypothetical protein